METKFDTLPIPSLVLRLGVPAMLAQFFNILYSIVDRIFVGHISDYGNLALASIGVCAPALTALTAFASLIGIGGASVMSISMGRREPAAAQRAISTSFSLLLSVSVVLTLVLLLLEKPLLFQLGCSHALYPYASAYFQTYVLGTAASLVGLGMNQFILAQGFARRGMVAVILGAMVNTVLDPVLIFGCRLGIRGAALATVLAQLCVLVFVLHFLLGERAAIPLRIQGLQWGMAQRILSIGCLPFFIVLLDNLLMILLNATLQQYGGDTLGDQYISCAAVVQSFMVLAYYPAQGITTGCGTLYSYHFGAGNIQKVMAVFRWVLLLCASFMGVLLVVSQTIPEVFARLFLQDETLLPLAADCIRRYAAGLLGVAVQYAFVDGLTAMGQTRYALPISFFRKGLFILCVFLLPRILPLKEIFWSAAISDLVGATVTVVVFLRLISPRLQKSMEAPTPDSL